MFRHLLAALLCIAITGFMAGASADDQAAAEQKMTAEQFLAGLKFQAGKISLPGGIATLDLPASFRYLSPDDAGHLLADGWGNPPGAKTLGMIVPAAVNPLSEAGWGVVITYDKDGHVKDDDADGIDYDELLEEMQEEIEAANAERKQAGFGQTSLVGWAEPPRYDKGAHKLFWAKELKFDGSDQNTLNYNVRVLGREGVLVLNAVAGMAQIAAVKGEMRHVTAFTEFAPGHRYADFNGATDKVAEYGIAALVAGGVAAKLGLFGKVLALLLAFKKLVLIAVFGLGAAIFKLFGGRKKVSLDK